MPASTVQPAAETLDEAFSRAGAQEVPSATEQFIRERSSLPEDVVELQTRIRLIVSRMENAIVNHDFAKAREYSDEERREHDKLRLLYKQHALSDWIFD